MSTKKNFLYFTIYAIGYSGLYKIGIDEKLQVYYTSVDNTFEIVGTFEKIPDLTLSSEEEFFQFDLINDYGIPSLALKKLQYELKYNIKEYLDNFCRSIEY